MIRDPSDGSVREAPKAEKPMTGITPAMPDTGIRQPVRTDAQERLEQSRAWLKQYHATKETTHARGSNGEEHSADGRTGNDQGEGQS